MSLLTLSKKEMQEIEAKGFTAVKNPTYIVGDKICTMHAWLVYVEGKGFVRQGYGTKSVALLNVTYSMTI